jgi:hypothetical protein
VTFEDQIIAGLEARGVEAVRLLVQAGQIAPSHIETTLQWLRVKDAEAARQAESWRTQEALTARAQNNRENMVAVMATVAAISGVLAVIIGFLAWMFPRT